MRRRSSRRVEWLPVSVLSDVQVARENMRRHHWRRYFECCRAGDKVLAAYHRKLAESVRV